MSGADDTAAQPWARAPVSSHELRERAFAAHAQGRTAEAARSYDILIEASPKDFQVLAMAAVLAAQTGQPMRASELFGRALEINPASPQAHNNLGIVLTTLERHAEAVARFDRAIALDPSYGEAYSNRGVALGHLKRWEEALENHDASIRLQPLAAAPHSNRSGALRMLRRPREALRSCETALALAPENLQALVNRAQLLCELRRPQEALASAERALALSPDFASALIARARAQQLLGADEAALSSLDRALALEPEHAEALSQRAAALCALGRCADALAGCDRAIGLDKELVSARIHRGMALAGLGLREAALDSFEEAIGLDNRDSVAHYARAQALERLERFEEAFAAYDRSIALEPEEPETYFSKAACLLRLGRFDDGWPLYEWRRRRGPAEAARRFAPPQARWPGPERVPGSSVLLHWEQGYGDTIQFCRYAKLAHERGARVLLNVQPALNRLIRSLSPEIKIVADADVGEAAYECPLMSLPAAFGAQLGAIPGVVPYLAAEADRIDHWGTRIGRAGYRIGICWQGAPGRVDIGRSFQLQLFRRIASLPDVRLISLQKGQAASQLADLPPEMAVETLGSDYDAGPDAFLDTAAVMEHLDLVITSDTAIAHLAGALARPAWVALHHVPEWRWLLGRVDSPWYPTLRLFRQREAGDWETVFEDIYLALESRLTQRAGAPALRRTNPQ
jgi:tetratricopeptide (TPR) repeat protein